jgi:hypothetical protein
MKNMVELWFMWLEDIKRKKGEKRRRRELK